MFVGFTVSTVCFQNSVVITDTHGWPGGRRVYHGFNEELLPVCEPRPLLWRSNETNMSAGLHQLHGHKVFGSTFQALCSSSTKLELKLAAVTVTTLRFKSNLLL